MFSHVLYLVNAVGFLGFFFLLIRQLKNNRLFSVPSSRFLPSGPSARSAVTLAALHPSLVSSTFHDV